MQFSIRRFPHETEMQSWRSEKFSGQSIRRGYSFYSWRNKTRKSALILHSFPHLYMHRRITACIWKPCIIPRTQNCRVLSRKRWYACMCCIITDGFIQNAWTVYCPTWHLHTFHGNAPLKFRCNTNTFRTTS